MSERPQHLGFDPARVEVEINGLHVTYAPRYRIFLDAMESGRWQTISIDPDEEAVRLVQTLITARRVANAEDVLDLDEDPTALAQRLEAVAREGVGMDDLHRSLSLPQIRAVLEMVEAAGLVVMEGETR